MWADWGGQTAAAVSNRLYQRRTPGDLAGAGHRGWSEAPRGAHASGRHHQDHLAADELRALYTLLCTASKACFRLRRDMQCGAAAARALAEPCCSGRRLEAAQSRHSSALRPVRRAGRAGRCAQAAAAAAAGLLPLCFFASLLAALQSCKCCRFRLFGRRQLRAAALLDGVELPVAAGSLQASLPHLTHLPAAAADQLAALAAQAGVEHDTLAQLLTLGDAAVQRIADLADTAAAAAEPTKKDNGWLQPLVTALETVLTFIEVGAAEEGSWHSLWQQRWPTRCSFVALLPAPLVTETSMVLRQALGAAWLLGLPVQDGLKKLNVPYSYGWSIVALTAVIKLVTFPLTKKQASAQRCEPPTGAGKRTTPAEWSRSEACLCFLCRLRAHSTFKS